MSIKPSRGGTVQISGKQYSVIASPERDNDRFLLFVYSEVEGLISIAESELWRGGRGPWKIIKGEAADQLRCTTKQQASNGECK